MQEITEDKESEIVEEEEKREFTRPVILATVISSIGFLQYGYNFWVLHFPAVILMNFHNATDEKKRDFNILHQSILFFFFFVAIALYPLGGFIGSFIFAPLADTCGRKQTLLINSFFSMTCAILMGFSKMAAAYEFSMFSRFITGVSSGWPILMGFAGFIALFQILPLFYVPESPRYLLMQNGDEEKARQVLRKLTGQDDVEEEMEDLQMEDHAERTEKNMTVFKLIRFPGPQRRFAIIFVLMFAQQFTGYSAVYYYVDGIYLSTGLRKEMLHNLHIVTFICLVLVSFMSMQLIDSVGRRNLLLAGFGICAICSSLLTMTIYFQRTHLWLSFINTILIILFLLGHFIGPGLIPHLLVAELFLQSARCSAFAISGAMFWLCRFIATLTLGGIEAALKEYTFLVYLPVGIVTFIFIYTLIPETKKKTFREIRKILAAEATKKIVVM